MYIETETTPNPATLKFLPGQAVMPTGTREFVSPEAAEASPLADALFGTGEANVLEGRVETRYGPGLTESVVSEPGDFLFIPPGVPHQPFNLSATEPARAVVARNDANEAERVVPYDPREAPAR